jgi:hypothetical protein
MFGGSNVSRPAPIPDPAIPRYAASLSGTNRGHHRKTPAGPAGGGTPRTPLLVSVIQRDVVKGDVVFRLRTVLPIALLTA